jgi:LysM repeat protein
MECEKMDTLSSIATKFKTSPEILLSTNTDVLALSAHDTPLESVNKGMQIKVPNLYASAPSPCKPVNGAWDCYTVRFNDTLHKISLNVSVHEDVLCEVNSIADCDLIQPGQVLSVPRTGYRSIGDVGYDTGCTSSNGKGSFFCYTVPAKDGYSFQGGYGVSPYQLTGMVGLSTYGTYTVGGTANFMTSLCKLNVDLLPSGVNCSVYHGWDFADTKTTRVWFMPGATIRVPYPDCVPSLEYGCAPQTDETLLSHFQDDTFFGPMTLFYFENNGFLPIRATFPVVEEYIWYKYPRHTIPPPYPNSASFYNLTHGRAADGSSLPPSASNPSIVELENYLRRGERVPDQLRQQIDLLVHPGMCYISVQIEVGCVS